MSLTRRTFPLTEKTSSKNLSFINQDKLSRFCHKLSCVVLSRHRANCRADIFRTNSRERVRSYPSELATTTTTEMLGFGSSCALKFMLFKYILMYSEVYSSFLACAFPGSLFQLVFVRADVVAVPLGFCQRRHRPAWISFIMLN